MAYSHSGVAGDAGLGAPAPDPDRGAPAREVKDPKRGQERRLLKHAGVLSWTLLVVGLIASGIAGLAWRTSTQNNANNSAAAAANSVRARMSQSLQDDFDVAGNAGTLVAMNPALSNSQLKQWFGLDGGSARHPGVLAIVFVQNVTLAGLPSFETAVTADPPFGISVGPFQLSPPGVRSNYCLMRLGDMQVHVSPALNKTFQQSMDAFESFIDPGADECALKDSWGLGPSAATGIATVGSLQSLITGTSASAADSDLTALFGPVRPSFESVPVYSSGLVSTSADRQAHLLGWVVMLVAMNPLINSAVSTQPHLALTVTYNEPSGSSLLLGLSGHRVAGAYEETVSAGPSGRWILHLAVPPPGGLTPRVQGTVLFLGGFLLTLLLFMLIRLLTMSRSQALLLVEKKTGELEHQARHSSLTGLPNRSMIYERVEHAMTLASAGGPGVVLLIIDLDAFKDINDTFGHDIGDDLLQQVADRLSTHFASTCTVGHTGADEFIVLADRAPVEDPEKLARDVLSTLAEPYTVESAPDVPLLMTASIGMATGLRSSVNHLLRDADIALHEAKAVGKNRFVVFRPEMHTAVVDRYDLESELHGALQGEQLFLVYQPIFDLDSMQVKGVEALLRWRHPTRGVVPPMEFIPTLESTGMILDVGRWVLEEACRQLRTWHDTGHSLSVSVNASAKQFEAGDLVRDVQNALKHSGLDPRFLVIEITESVLMRDPVGMAEQLRQLKRAGVRVAIDDFGTGYSSMAYLRQFPVDILKIDRSFVSDMTTSGEGLALVCTLVSLGKTLGLETVAEGIEDEIQLRQLQREGCDNGQGFYYARPLEPTDAERFIAERTRAVRADVDVVTWDAVVKVNGVAPPGNGSRHDARAPSATGPRKSNAKGATPNGSRGKALDAGAGDGPQVPRTSAPS
jgi:diguanylate cyclase (GGDEF)-like protein